MTTPILPIPEDFNLTVSGGVTSVFSLDHIIFEGLDVTDTGSGTVTVTATIPPPPPVITPGGNNGELQYNNVGVFGGATGVTYSSTGTRLTVSGGPISCPGSGANSERFGAGAVADGVASAAFGPTALAMITDATAVGGSANASGQGATAVGRAAVASGFFATAIGVLSSATAANSLAIGRQATAAFISSAAIGSGVALAENEMAFGSVNGFGATGSFRLTGHSSTQPRSLGQVTTEWVDSTDASRAARLTIRTNDHATPVTGREWMRCEADGTQAKGSFFGVDAVARQLVPTGSSTDDVIIALQNLGLFRQS